jgi:hypothetical protein
VLYPFKQRPREWNFNMNCVGAFGGRETRISVGESQTGGPEWQAGLKKHSKDPTCKGGVWGTRGQP